MFLSWIQFREPQVKSMKSPFNKKNMIKLELKDIERDCNVEPRQINRGIKRSLYYISIGNCNQCTQLMDGGEIGNWNWNWTSRRALMNVKWSNELFQCFMNENMCTVCLGEYFLIEEELCLILSSYEVFPFLSWKIHMLITIKLLKIVLRANKNPLLCKIVKYALRAAENI